MTRLAILLIALATAWPGTARPAEWSLGASVSQTFEVAQNPGLDFDDDPASDGVEFGTISQLGLTLGARTPRTVWSLGTGGNLRFFTGQDDGDGDDNINGFRPNLSGQMTYAAPTWSLSNRAGVSVTSTAFDELRFIPAQIDPEDQPPDQPTDIFGTLVPVDREVDRISFNAGSTLSLSLSPRNTATLGLSYSGQRFSESVRGFSNSDNFGSTLTFDRQLSPESSGGFTLSVLRFTSEDNEVPDSQEGINVGLRGNYSTRIAGDSRIGLSLGASYTDETEESFPSGIRVRDEDQTIGATGRLSLTLNYPRMSVDLALLQDVRPSTTGETRNVTGVNAVMRREVLQRLRLSLAARYTLETDIGFGGDPEHFLSVGPALIYELDQDWRAQFGYTFRAKDEVGGSAISNSVGLTLSRDFSLLR